MVYSFQFIHPYIWYSTLFFIVCTAFLRLVWYRLPRYRYALTSELAASGTASRQNGFRNLLFFLRLASAVLLALVAGRPQLVDPSSKVSIEGVAIVLVLDASFSMAESSDGAQNGRSRFAVAKEEAIRFVAKRPDDPIGLVFFARYAISRCPLTLDKQILTKFLAESELGDIDPRGTMLSLGMLTGINRLKHINAKSKVLVVLTDGTPSLEDIDSRVPLGIAKELGIKIYTIGVGSSEVTLMQHPIYGAFSPSDSYNPQLLQYIADDTGGKFFEARDQRDLQHIYDEIDRMETSQQDTTVFTRKFEWYYAPTAMAIILLMFELFLKTFFWVLL